MSRFARLPIAFVLVSASITVYLAGCTPKSERVSGTGSAATEHEVDRNDILDDASMTDDKAMTVAEVQSFLEKTPYGKRSVLASYRPKGKPASTIIVETAVEYSLNPKLLLVRAQLEQALISKQTATAHELDRAYGCGCVDTPSKTGGAGSHTCSAQFVGFENQVRCAASHLRKYLDDLASPKHATVSGWAKGKPHKTSDGIAVTPKNDATAALYTYTPWVGKLGGGDSRVGGTSAHWQLWNDFDGATPDPTEAPTLTRDGGRDAAEPTSAPSCEGTCRAGTVCSESGTCVSGCRVVGATDSCAAGLRCSNEDGLIGTCQREACVCPSGMICDESSGSQKCVECTSNDTSRCRSEAEGDRCVVGRCGCRTSADCGYDRGRKCDTLRGVCIDDPHPQDPESKETPDAGAPGSPAPGDLEPGASTLPSAPEPAPTPEMPESAPSSGKDGASKKSTKAEETIDVPSSESSGCSAAPPTPDRGLGTGALGLGLALAAALGRRRRRTARAPAAHAAAIPAVSSSRRDLCDLLETERGPATARAHHLGPARERETDGATRFVSVEPLRGAPVEAIRDRHDLPRERRSRARTAVDDSACVRLRTARRGPTEGLRAVRDRRDDERRPRRGEPACEARHLGARASR